jgi:magnesium-transporting ATPase (P-type)
MPSYPEYLIDVLTEPFFLLQYFFCFIFFIQGYAPFSFALLFFSFVTTTVNYVMLYVSYKRIKSIAEKISQVDVIRNGQKIKLDSRELVPGDVYIPQN